jgi:hypothetical protein
LSIDKANIEGYCGEAFLKRYRVAVRGKGFTQTCAAHRFLFCTKEDNMLEVTASATQQIAEYFKGKDVAPIRIFLNEGG